MCKIPSRILPFLSSIPPALWLFAVLKNTSCVENILIAAAMVISILAMHHKYIKYDYTAAPAIWLWMSIRGSIFIPHYISAATGVVMFIVSRYQPFKRIGLVTCGIWATHFVLAVGGFAYYPYWWGILPTLTTEGQGLTDVYELLTHHDSIHTAEGSTGTGHHTVLPS